MSMANTTVGLRWAKADENFRIQIDTLKAKMRADSKAQIADAAGIKTSTFYQRYKHPCQLTKREERMLASLFERFGMVYDPTLGEGAPA